MVAPCSSGTASALHSSSQSRATCNAGARQPANAAEYNSGNGWLHCWLPPQLPCGGVVSRSCIGCEAACLSPVLADARFSTTKEAVKREKPAHLPLDEGHTDQARKQGTARSCREATDGRERGVNWRWACTQATHSWQGKRSVWHAFHVNLHLAPHYARGWCTGSQGDGDEPLWRPTAMQALCCKPARSLCTHRSRRRSRRWCCR